MGFTPLEGLMMSTRSGDIDPAIFYYLVAKMKINIEDVYNILNNRSGILGVSGKSKDMRYILKNYQSNKRCELTLDMFCYRVIKYIGSYAAVLGRVNAIVFTGGIGENANIVRQKISSNLSALGISIDKKKNDRAIGKEGDISRKNSKIKILVIPANEEKMIALEALGIAG
jgi:acetate kinase